MSATHKTVPVEPTVKMSKAGEAQYSRTGLGVWSDFRAIYRAMIEAAPEPPATSDAMRDRIVAVLDAVANAAALKNVRSLVAGWNGEGKPGAPFERHPGRLGARIETNCGAVYALDEALVAARALLAELTATATADHIPDAGNMVGQPSPDTGAR
jgi:hypothetical protein